MSKAMNGGCSPSNGVNSPQREPMLLIGYARVSTSNSQQDSSVKSQDERLRKYGCVDVYTDRQSGTTFSRDALLKFKHRVLSEVKHQPVKAVFAYGDRTGRNHIEWVVMIDELQQAGVLCWSLDEGEIDLNDPANRLIWNIKTSVWEFQALETRAKIRGAAKRRRENGKRMGGKPPFGYQWVEGNAKLVPDPSQWEIAKAIVGKYLDGLGLDSICQWLVTEYQVNFSGSGLLRWLQNPALLGHTRHKRADGARLPMPIIFYNTHQALISASEWAQLRYRFEHNKYYPPGKTVRACSGLCRCADCRVRLELCTQHRKHLEPYVFFRCRGAKGERCPNSGTIRYDNVEPTILAAICARAEDISRAVLEPDEPQEDPKVLALQTDLETYRQMAQRRPRAELETLINNIEQEIAHIKAHSQELQAEDARLDDLVVHLAKPQFWEGLSDKDRHQLYHELKVTVWCRGNQIVEVKLLA